MLLVDQAQVQIVVITYHPTLMKTQSLARTLVSEVAVRYYRTHVLESRVASCSFNILFIFRVKRSQQMYLHLVWHRLGSNTQNVRIVGPKGPDTLVWGFVLLHLSGVWLRELNEFKFLCFFLIWNTQPTPWVQYKPIKPLLLSLAPSLSILYSMLK